MIFWYFVFIRYSDKVLIVLARHYGYTLKMEMLSSVSKKKTVKSVQMGARCPQRVGIAKKSF